MMGGKRDMARAVGCGSVLAIYLAAIALSVMLLAGCTSTKYVPVESVRTEYVDRESVRVDSVTLLDSVIIRSAGDTVLIEKWRWRDRVSIVRDTVETVRTESVAVPYPVEKQLTRWERAKVDFGGLAIAFCGAVAVWLMVWIARTVRCKI